MSDTNDQRCTYNNCKNWQYDDIVSTPKLEATTCNECWTDEDIKLLLWDGKPSYPKDNTQFRLPEESFKLDTNSNKCILQCKAGYWSNYNSEIDANVQYCSSDNCKNWTYGGNLMDGQELRCIECWTKADLDSWETWLPRHTYKESSLAGRNIDEPFFHNQVDKACDLKCNDDHWINLKNHYVNTDDTVPELAINEKDTRCTHLNCKQFNYKETYWTNIYYSLKDIQDCNSQYIIADKITSGYIDWTGKAIFGGVEHAENDTFDNYSLNFKQREITLYGVRLKKQDKIALNEFDYVWEPIT